MKSASISRTDIEDQEESLSISWLDIEPGSPKIGDIIARIPEDPGYYWLVSEQQLKDNFEEIKQQHMKYDSKADTLLHIKRVSELLTNSAQELIVRANYHDQSKLESPEKELFDEFTPKLKDCTYGSEEYKGYLKELKVALDHHYANNSHHPEHYKNGVNGMNLFDLIEMFMDWKAAGERHEDGDIYKSIEINKERFNLSDQMVDILTNTADYLFPQ